MFRERTFALHRQQPDNKISKMLTLPFLLEKFMRAPMGSGKVDQINYDHAPNFYSLPLSFVFNMYGVDT